LALIHANSPLELIEDMKTFNVNTVDYYPHLVKGNNYPETYPEGLSIPEGGFRQGDVVFDTNHNTIALVLGTIDLQGGELRLDTDGMQPIDNLRFATLEDFENCKYRTDEFHNKLFEECCEQAGMVVKTFRVTAKIVKDVKVYVTKGDLTEDEIQETAQEMCNDQFNPNCDGTEEKYTQDNQEIPNFL